jgi:MoaA/NifB/PqqE/SkfB family radical SAM enzyme
LDALRYLPFAARGLARRGPPVHLTLFVTGRCNARCRHCFHWREVAAGVEGPSPEQVCALADSAARLGPLLWVSFGGGEPFLRRDLPELARAFGRHGLRHLAIPTNGLVEERQHEAVARILAESPDLHLSVGVSVDGPPQVHDALRQVPGGHARALGSFRALRRQREGLPRQQARRLGLGLLVAVTAANQDVLARHLEELVDELAPDNVTVNLARGAALEPGQLEVDPDRYAEVVAAKRRLMQAGRLPYFDFPLARLAVARDRQMYAHVERLARGDRSRHLPCTAGTLSAVVFEDGSVHPCEVLGRSIGNLNDCAWDFGQLWSTAAAEGLRREIDATRCACTWECAVADNVLFSARRWPALALEALRA